MGFISGLETAYRENASAENAEAMARYMKNRFAFFGIKTTERRALLKQAYEANRQEVKENARTIARRLFEKNEREYHYSAVEILMKELKKRFVKEDIALIEHLLVTHSWWDTVDTIAKYLLGGYLQQFPEETDAVISRFSDDGTMCLTVQAFYSSSVIKNKPMKPACFGNAPNTANRRNSSSAKPLGGPSANTARPIPML